MATVKFTTKRCFVCKKTTTLNLDKARYDKWKAGSYVQDAFPRLSASDRELLITGTHSECWEAKFGD